MACRLLRHTLEYSYFKTPHLHPARVARALFKSGGGESGAAHNCLPCRGGKDRGDCSRGPLNQPPTLFHAVRKPRPYRPAGRERPCARSPCTTCVGGKLTCVGGKLVRGISPRGLLSREQLTVSRPVATSATRSTTPRSELVFARLCVSANSTPREKPLVFSSAEDHT